MSSGGTGQGSVGTAAAGGRRRRGRPTETERREIRQTILDAAWAEFVEHGYGAATVQRIAERAQVGIATFYGHFPDKAGVFAATLENVGQVLSAEVAALGPGVELETGLLRFAERFIETFTTTHYEEATRLVYAEAARFPELTSVFLAYSVGWFDALAAFLGRFRPELAAGQLEDLAMLFIEMIGGRIHRERMLRLKWLPDEAVPAHLAMCVRIFTGGLAALA